MLERKSPLKRCWKIHELNYQWNKTRPRGRQAWMGSADFVRGSLPLNQPPCHNEEERELTRKGGVGNRTRTLRIGKSQFGVKTWSHFIFFLATALTMSYQIYLPTPTSKSNLLTLMGLWPSWLDFVHLCPLWILGQSYSGIQLSFLDFKAQWKLLGLWAVPEPPAALSGSEKGSLSWEPHSLLSGVAASPVGREHMNIHSPLC